RQFNANDRYFPIGDSAISKLSIPDDEDISYEMVVHKKRYEALFFQKPIKYDSLVRERDFLYAKGSLNESEKNRLELILAEMFDEMSFMKAVWFMVSEELRGKYYITMFYDNEYNKANGEDL